MQIPVATRSTLARPCQHFRADQDTTATMPELPPISSGTTLIGSDGLEDFQPFVSGSGMDARLKNSRGGK